MYNLNSGKRDKEINGIKSRCSVTASEETKKEDGNDGIDKRITDQTLPFPFVAFQELYYIKSVPVFV